MRLSRLSSPSIGQLAACASLPSSSLVKEPGDRNLRIHRSHRFDRKAGLIPLPSVAVNLFSPTDPGVAAEPCPRLAAEGGFYARYRTVSTAFFPNRSSRLRSLSGPTHRSTRFTGRVVLTDIATSCQPPFLVRFRRLGLPPRTIPPRLSSNWERDFYRYQSIPSTAFLPISSRRFSSSFKTAPPQLLPLGGRGFLLPHPQRVNRYFR